jgi:hypothetical protein
MTEQFVLISTGEEQLRTTFFAFKTVKLGNMKIKYSIIYTAKWVASAEGRALVVGNYDSMHLILVISDFDFLF